jgi:hypothetical protein
MFGRNIYDDGEGFSRPRGCDCFYDSEASDLLFARFGETTASNAVEPNTTGRENAGVLRADDVSR